MPNAPVRGDEILAISPVAETAWGTAATGVYVPIFIDKGGYTVRQTNVRSALKTNAPGVHRSTQKLLRTGIDVAGGLDLLFNWADRAKYFAWITRDANGLLPSYTLKYKLGALQALIHAGAMVNQLTLTGGDNQELRLAYDLIARSETDLVVGSYPAVTYPTLTPIPFGLCEFFATIGAGSEQRLHSVEAFSLAWNFGLKVGPHRCGGTDAHNGVISSLALCADRTDRIVHIPIRPGRLARRPHGGYAAGAENPDQRNVSDRDRRRYGFSG